LIPQALTGVNCAKRAFPDTASLMRPLLLAFDMEMVFL